jgi:hypothetical protein
MAALGSTILRGEKVADSGVNARIRYTTRDSLGSFLPDTFQMYAGSSTSALHNCHMPLTGQPVWSNN